MSTDNENLVTTLRDRFVKANVFAHEGKNGKFYNVSLSCSYKDGDQTKYAKSFSGQDILSASRLLQKAYDEILEREAADYTAANPQPSQD